MYLVTYELVYPEGDAVELPGPLPFNALVGLNGQVLTLPLSTARQIAYRVTRVQRSDSRGEEVHRYYLELVPAAELESYTSRRNSR